MNIPYETFTKTYVAKSTIYNAGIGLFSGQKLKKFDWIGFYPGIMGKREKVIGDLAYVMGTREPGIIISANGNIKDGVHLVNEGNNTNLPNVFYVKLTSGLCLYFAGRKIQKDEELLTCYSSSYGTRCYQIVDSNKCTDPRCKNMCKKGKLHRNKSLFCNGWKNELERKTPKFLKNCDVL